MLANTISTPDEFSLRRKDYISEMCFTDESLHVFVVVPVLITTGVTSRGEKGLIVKPKVTPTKQKAFPDWNLLDVLDVRLGNAVALK